MKVAFFNQFTFRRFLVTLVFTALYFLSSSVMASDADPAHHEHADAPIRVVMSAAFVSESGIEVYDEIFHYLGKKLGRKIDFVSGFSYSTINAMFDEGMVDVGFICGLPYVIKHDEAQPKVNLLLAPVMQNPKYNDKPVYYSYIIVRKDSRFDDFSDLKGAAFVYNDEISNSGYNMPRAHLISMGETSGFFGKVVRSGSHEESIRMVASGEADASAVDSLVYDYDLEKNPQYVQQLKVLKTLGPAGIPPVVVSTGLALELRNKIRDVLAGMKDDPAGRGILAKALIDRFTVVDDSNYDGIREMKKMSQNSGYLTIY